MTKDEQMAALKQAYNLEMSLLFTQILNSVRVGVADDVVTTEFIGTLDPLNKAFALASAAIEAQP